MKQNNNKNNIKIFLTGIREIDENLCGGLRCGDLCFISSKDKAGMERLLFEIAGNMANNGNKVHLFSLDKKTETISQLSVLQRNKKANLIIDNTLSRDLDSIISKFINVESEVVFLDAINSICISGKHDNPSEAVSETAFRLRTVAESTNIPIVCCISIPTRDNKELSICDFQEFGMVEQDASEIIVVNSISNTSESNYNVEMSIIKNRYGNVGHYSSINVFGK